MKWKTNTSHKAKFSVVENKSPRVLGTEMEAFQMFDEVSRS